MRNLVFIVHTFVDHPRQTFGSGLAQNTIVADSLLMKQQLLVISRSRKRAPNLSVINRFLLGFWSLFRSPRHIWRTTIIIRPSTLLRFHEALKKWKYRLLYTSRKRASQDTLPLFAVSGRAFIWFKLVKIAFGLLLGLVGLYMLS